MKLGIVFAGGGGKGAYEIGVWKALKEFGIDKEIACISGTSVGSLNSLLFLQGNYERAEKTWLNLGNDKILKVKIDQVLKFIISLFTKAKLSTSSKLLSAWLIKLKNYGVFSKEGLIDIIEENIDLDKISKSDIKCFSACTQTTLPFKTEYFKLNQRSTDQINAIVLASSSIPVFYDSEKIDDLNYMDGGIPLIGDNVPIKPLIDEKCDKIIIVHLSRDYIIDKDKYPKTQFFEIIPKESPGGLFNGTLNFNQNKIRELILDGYKDTYTVLNQAFNFVDKFNKFREGIHELLEEEKQSITEIRSILEKTEELKNENLRLVQDFQ